MSAGLYSNPDWLCIHKVVHYQCEKCKHPELDRPTIAQRPVSSQLSRIEQADGMLLAAIHGLEKHLEGLQFALEHQAERNHEFTAGVLGSLENRIIESLSKQNSDYKDRIRMDSEFVHAWINKVGGALKGMHELYGLMQAECSEASSFRKEIRGSKPAKKRSKRK